MSRERLLGGETLRREAGSVTERNGHRVASVIFVSQGILGGGFRLIDDYGHKIACEEERTLIAADFDARDPRRGVHYTK